MSIGSKSLKKVVVDVQDNKGSSCSGNTLASVPLIQSYFNSKRLAIALRQRAVIATARVCPAGFGEAFELVFVLNYWLRELPLSEISNLFELRCESKATDAIVLRNLPLLSKTLSFQLNVLNEALATFVVILPLDFCKNFNIVKIQMFLFFVKS